MQGDGAPDGVVDGNRAALGLMLAGEDQQVLDDLPCSLGLGVDLLDILARLINDALVAEQQLGVAANAGERIR